jgi:C-terminal processing protease CtpA/Prc
MTMKPYHRFVAVAALLATGLIPSAARAGDATPPADAEDAQTRSREREMRDLEEQLRAAQAQMRDAARRLADLNNTMNRSQRLMGRRMVWISDHAGLGVVVRTAPDASADLSGARLQAVTPGGPADQAGLKTGDLLTSINGVPLAGGASKVHAATGDDDDDMDADAGMDEEATPPGVLIREVRKLKEGDKVKIEYRRGKESRTTTVTARRLDSQERIAISISPEVHVDPTIAGEIPGPGPIAMAMPWGWTQMELVSLNPDLGQYFATDHGVLVIRAPGDGGLRLKGGDVILKIGDETPESPTNAMRLLRASESDEPIQILVLRKGEKVKVTAEAGMAHPRRRAPVTPPLPPAPPAPPAPRDGSHDSL